MNILVLDDDAAELAAAVEYLTDLGHVARPFKEAEKLLTDYAKSPGWAEAALFDIVLPQEDSSGINAAKALREQGFTGAIVFLTSSNEFAMESYQVAATGYILKPVTVEKIAQAEELFTAEAARRAPRTLAIKDGQTVQTINLLSLMYLEVTGNNLTFHLAEPPSVRIRAPLKDYEGKLLAHETFGKIHRSFIVNLAYIKKIAGREVFLRNGTRLPLAKGKEQFKKQFIAAHANGVIGGTGE
jgi:DNA-binding LytR/AlgR family response regulator